MPLIEGFIHRKDLLEIQWKNKGKTRGKHYEK
jgi:hypothetical protein